MNGTFIHKSNNTGSHQLKSAPIEEIMRNIEIVGPGQELVFTSTDERHLEAREAAKTVEDLHAVAEAAGFGEWLDSARSYPITTIGPSVSEALRMPFPSPTVQAWRTEAGYPKGVKTNENDTAWSLEIGEPNLDLYDTGVRLVACKKSPDSIEYDLRLPLDIAISPYFFRHDRGRPDRLKVDVGNRQLNGRQTFSGEEAQRLLIVAHKFIEILRLESQYDQGQ